MASRELTKILADAEKSYDKDDFIGGLKFVKKHLKKYEKCGELVAWHALFLLKNKHTEEAVKESNIAIRLDMKNPKIWKINGIINKENGEYLKALQCFTQSNKMKDGDTAVLGELASLSLHMNNLSDFMEYSCQLMKLNPQSSNVIRYIFALHFNDDNTSAIKYLEQFESKLPPSPSEEEILFRAEMGRFHSYLLIQNHDYKGCIEYLEKQLFITDRISILEDKATCYEKLGDNEKTIETVKELLKEYPDNGDYFAILERLLPREKYLEELHSLKDSLKSKWAHVRILELIDINDPEFEPLLEAHLLPLLKKGSPAIFATIADFSDAKLDKALEFANKVELPLSSFPIVRVLAGQIRMRENRLDEALAEVDAGIAHTPTVVELYVTKANILNKAGRTREALAAAEELAALDPADRNSNNLLVRCLYRAGKVKTARLTAQPFSIDQKKNPRLFKTEFNKVHLRAARASLRGGKTDDALNFYRDVVAHFDEYRNGMISYFSWGVRRAKSLVDMIEWGLRVQNHKQFGRAFAGAARIYLSRGDLTGLRQLCMRAVRSKNQDALAYMAVAFALLKEPLPALRCFVKLEGSRRFLAAPAMAALAKEAAGFPAPVAEVFGELYKPLTDAPETPDDLLAAARGLVYVKDAGAKAALERAADAACTFAGAVDVCLAAQAEMGDEKLAEELRARINKRLPQYEIAVTDFEEDEPHEHNIKREK